MGSSEMRGHSLKRMFDHDRCMLAMRWCLPFRTRMQQLQHGDHHHQLRLDSPRESISVSSHKPACNHRLQHTAVKRKFLARMRQQVGTGVGIYLEDTMTNEVDEMNIDPQTVTLENIPNMVFSQSATKLRSSFTTVATASSSSGSDDNMGSRGRKRPFGSMVMTDADDDASSPSKRPSYVMTDADLDDDADADEAPSSGSQPQVPQHQQHATVLSSSITLPVNRNALLSSILNNSSSMSAMNAMVQAAEPASPTSSAAAMPRAAAATVPSVGSVPRACSKEVISSPHEFFTNMLRARGYPATTHCSLKCGYHNSPTKQQTTSYGVSLTKAIRSSDVASAQTLLRSGLHPNACNKFGESIVHAACRRGDSPMLRALIAAGSSVQVSDDFGRTPLHDACWTSSTCFEAIRILLDQDPWLLSIMDCRGSTPLGYVRKAHWAVWIGFLGAIADRYWPDLEGFDLEGSGRHTAPPLAFVEANTRQMPDPRESPSLEVIELLANGKLTPQDLEDGEGNLRPETYREKENKDIPRVSRITLDPMRTSGIGNATTMTKPHGAAAKADGPAPLLQGYVRVTAGAGGL